MPDEVLRRKLEKIDDALDKSKANDIEQNAALRTIVDGFNDHVDKCHTATRTERNSQIEIIRRLDKNSNDLQWIKGLGAFYVVMQMEFIQIFFSKLVE